MSAKTCTVQVATNDPECLHQICIVQMTTANPKYLHQYMYSTIQALSGQNHLARRSERGKKTRQTEEEVGRQHQGMDRLRVRQVPGGSGEQGTMEKTGCKIICCAPTTLAVKGLMMMMTIQAATSDPKYLHQNVCYGSGRQ